MVEMDIKNEGGLYGLTLTSPDFLASACKREENNIIDKNWQSHPAHKIIILQRKHNWGKPS